MRILVLGGNGFVGRAIVVDALAHGAEVTSFSRGLSGEPLPGEVVQLVGDRDAGDYAALASGEWDAVVDLSGYQTKQVDEAMDVLGDRVGRYVFVSSHAVYVRTLPAGATEDAPRQAPLRAADVLTNETYGRCKVACEDDVLARYGDRATLVRPGRVTGPGDSGDTALYWVRRGARGGRVAVPTSLEQPLQFIDSRDVARLTVRLIADDRSGAFNAIGPESTIGELITTAAEIAGTSVDLVQVPTDAVPERFPLVEPEEIWPARRRDPSKARAAGMPVTPLKQTLTDLLAWDRDRGAPAVEAGLSEEAEAELLRRR
ncbi:NAD-dependent epimerase/dehydratase family protein [Kribbella antibiotica]|uniref:NAD-dependent epimerase/dehydratase family protein n=1 Tax=Kribbella antibiotica TaxID=190195 RepID=A0A4V2YKR7_9ACTN|nr:NAD-dependent epimerase/dehydratase family protein [Kribbella antibiotica]TDD43847.1 NAD-dependent epimerase/dehydratase family protein [Kribbella antibiotica]